jgi:uncharacterized membrane-anchored protein YjiN (DUF445 family)
VALIPDVRDERIRRRGLRQMKSVAAGLLVLAALVYVLATWWDRSPDAPAVAGYLQTAAEAGMVGGLADWFAVTALFRRPLGLPIPHTAIIPTRKDALGQSLGAFVGEHFLSAEAVRARLDSAQVATRAGAWLSERGNAERVTSEAATVVRAGLALLRDEDVAPIVEQVVARRLVDLHVGPALGRVLGQVVTDGAHAGLVDTVARSVHRWLVVNETAVIDLVAAQAPDWTPRFVDERVARRVHSELVRIAGEVVDDRDHDIRRALDRYLVRLADDLRRDLDTNARVDAFVETLGRNGEVRQVIAAVMAAGRRTVLELVDDPTSELRVRSRELLAAWGRRLGTDAKAAAKVDAWLAQVAVYVVEGYRDEITRLITDTVDRWDGRETSRRIELAVGRDLQFIRLNGTVVGSLVGLVIHAVSQLLL